MTADSDSYTWLATDTYFSHAWNDRFSRDEPPPSGDHEDAPDDDNTSVAGDQICEAKGVPSQDDCSTLLLYIPDSADPIDLTQSGHCYSRDGTPLNGVIFILHIVVKYLLGGICRKTEGKTHRESPSWHA